MSTEHGEAPRTAPDALGDRGADLADDRYEAERQRLIALGSLSAGIAHDFNNTGIPTELLGDIFRPDVSTKGRGRGLGLATVRAIVERHAGRLTVDTGSDGTTFRLWIPRLDVEAAERPTIDEHPVPSGLETVVLVEDEADVRRVAGLILRGLGYALVDMDGPHEALAWATDPAHHLDVLLTDVKMPGMDGVELAARIRQQRPDLPVLLMSGYTDQAIDEILAERDHDGFLAKPFTREALARQLRLVLDGIPGTA